MSKRFADTDKYKKPFMRGLPAAYKLLWDYICLDCNNSGIWQVDFDVAQIRIGTDAPIEQSKALAVFNMGEERIRVLNGGSKWFIVPFVEFQYGELDHECRPHRPVIKELEHFGLIPYQKGIERVSNTLEDKDKDMDKDKDKGGMGGNAVKVSAKFQKPTVEEVKVYCLEQNNGIDAESFVNFYESKGWKIGKSPMKNWKAAVRTWVSKRKENGSGGICGGSRPILTDLEKEVLLDYKSGRGILGNDEDYILHNGKTLKNAASSLISALGTREAIIAFLEQYSRDMAKYPNWTINSAAKAAWEARK